MPSLSFVDPHKQRSRLYFAVARLSATKFGAWFSVNVAWKLDPFLLKLTGGRLSSAGPLAVGLLESRGARSGLPRRNATLYFHDGDRVTIIASSAGCRRTPPGSTTYARTPTSSTAACRFARSSSRARPSGNGSGRLPTASFPSTPTTASAPAAPGASSRYFSCCLGSSLSVLRIAFASCLQASTSQSPTRPTS